MNTESTAGMPSQAEEMARPGDFGGPADSDPAWGPKYAQWYDLIHVEHDYHGASASYNHIIRDRFGIQPVRVLEFGCGTGVFSYFLTHNLPSGSTVVGYDDSHDMLEHAYANYDRNRKICTDELPDGPFDVIVAHFNVVNYLPYFQTWAQMMDSRLVEGGLLMFDCLNAEDVKRRGPEQWTRRRKTGAMSAEVSCAPTMNGERLELRYHIRVFKHRELLDQFEVDHQVSLHLLTEIVGCLTLAGRKYLSIEPFGAGRLYVSRRLP